MRSVSGERSSGWRATAFLVVLALGLGACEAEDIELGATATAPAPRERVASPVAVATREPTHSPPTTLIHAGPGYHDHATPEPIDLSAAERRVMGWGVPQGGPRLERSARLPAEAVYEALLDQWHGSIPWEEPGALPCLTTVDSSGFPARPHEAIERTDWLAQHSEELLAVEASHAGMDFESPFDLGRGTRNRPRQSDRGIVSASERYTITALFDPRDSALVCLAYEPIPSLWTKHAIAYGSDASEESESAAERADAQGNDDAERAHEHAVAPSELDLAFERFLPEPGTRLGYLRRAVRFGHMWTTESFTETVHATARRPNGQLEIRTSREGPAAEGERTIWDRLDHPDYLMPKSTSRLADDGEIVPFPTASCGPGCSPISFDELSPEPGDGRLETPAGTLEGCEILLQVQGNATPIVRTVWLCPGVGIARIEQQISRASAVAAPSLGYELTELVTIDRATEIEPSP